MGDDDTSALTPLTSRRTVSRVQQHLSQYLSDRDVREVGKEGAKHLMAEFVQAAKADAGQQLTHELALHTFTRGLFEASSRI